MTGPSRCYWQRQHWEAVDLFKVIHGNLDLDYGDGKGRLSLWGLMTGTEWDIWKKREKLKIIPNFYLEGLNDNVVIKVGSRKMNCFMMEDNGFY